MDVNVFFYVFLWVSYISYKVFFNFQMESFRNARFSLLFGLPAKNFLCCMMKNKENMYVALFFLSVHVLPPPIECLCCGSNGEAPDKIDSALHGEEGLSLFQAVVAQPTK